MFFPDKRRGYEEARRVLRPGGRFNFSVWDRIEANEVTYCATEAVKTIFPADAKIPLRERLTAMLILLPFAMGCDKLGSSASRSTPLRR